MATSRSIPTAPLRRLPRASAKFAPALAAALAALLLHALPLRAQHPDFYRQPDTLVFGYSAGLVESVYVTCDIDLRWYVSNPQAGGDLFAIDVYEGVSSDFIQVRTLQSNRTGSDRRCTFYFRDDNWHSANLVIIQKPYVEPTPTPPEPDPDWDLDIPGNWILSRSYSDPADSSVFHDDITFYDGLGYPVQTVLLRGDGPPAGTSETLAFGPDANLLSAERSTDGTGTDSLALSYDGVLLSSAGGRSAEHDAAGALSLHPLSGARIFRNPLGGLSALEGEGGGHRLQGPGPLRHPAQQGPVAQVHPVEEAQGDDAFFHWEIRSFPILPGDGTVTPGKSSSPWSGSARRCGPEPGIPRPLRIPGSSPPPGRGRGRGRRCAPSSPRRGPG